MMNYTYLDLFEISFTTSQKLINDEPLFVEKFRGEKKSLLYKEPHQAKLYVWLFP